MSSHGNSLFLRESGQRLGRVGWLQQLQESMQQRALRTRLRLQTMTREHVLRFMRRNAFILLTVSAVIIGEWAGRAGIAGKFLVCSSLHSTDSFLPARMHTSCPTSDPHSPGQDTPTVHTMLHGCVCVHTHTCVHYTNTLSAYEHKHKHIIFMHAQNLQLQTCKHIGYTYWNLQTPTQAHTFLCTHINIPMSLNTHILACLKTIYIWSHYIYTQENYVHFMCMGSCIQAQTCMNECLLLHAYVQTFTHKFTVSTW